jgi:hypothetical protein
MKGNLNAARCKAWSEEWTVVVLVERNLCVDTQTEYAGGLDWREAFDRGDEFGEPLRGAKAGSDFFAEEMKYLEVFEQEVAHVLVEAGHEDAPVVVGDAPADLISQ